jgi:hypothetical protein
MIRFIFLAPVILAVSGCLSDAADKLQSGQVMNLFGLEGRWAGPVAPKADGCGRTATGLMTVGGKTFAFDPFQGTTVINGTMSDAGILEGTLSRPGGGQQVVSISFSGTATHHVDGEDTIDGQLVSGRCSWTVELKRG